MKKMNNSQQLFIISALYFGAISVVSQIPGQTIGQLELDIWDKGLHFVEYSILGLLLGSGFAFRSLKKRQRPVLLIGAGCLLIVVAGCIDEFHQMFVPGRQCSLTDVFADVLGGMSGFICGFAGVLAKRES